MEIERDVAYKVFRIYAIGFGFLDHARGAFCHLWCANGR